MDEDRISNLPDDVLSHILSSLPKKVAVQTSILSKAWKHKWMSSLCVVQLDDKALDSQYLKRCIADGLMRGVRSLEINSSRSVENAFVDDLYNWRSLTELKLVLCCTLSTSLMKNGFPNLKVLYLGHSVCLSNDKYPRTSKAVLNFPALEEFELRCCRWRGVKSVDVNAPALTSFLAEGRYGRSPYDYVIKIHAAKLEKFESCGYLLDNYVVPSPSVSKAVFTNREGCTALGFRAHAILKGFSTLEYLKVSIAIANALTESNVGFNLPCFNRLKQLEIEDYMWNGELLEKLLRVLPYLESLSLSVYVERLEVFPSGIAHRLKVVNLAGFAGTNSQLDFARSVLKNADNLETLFVCVCYNASWTRSQIQQFLLRCPKSSPSATVVVI